MPFGGILFFLLTYEPRMNQALSFFLNKSLVKWLIIGKTNSTITFSHGDILGLDLVYVCHNRITL